MNLLRRNTGPLLALGGALWILYYALFVILGHTYGMNDNGTFRADPSATPLVAISIAAFLLALVGIGSGLVGLSFYPKGRKTQLLRRAGWVFAAIVVGAGATGLALFATSFIGRPGLLGGVGVLGSCISATLLGIACWRGHTLPSVPRVLLPIVGIATFPFIVLIVALLPNLPAYSRDELPFAVAGAAWIIIGMSLVNARRPIPESDAVTA